MSEKPDKTSGDNDGKVEIEKAQLNGLLARLSALEEANAGHERKAGLFPKEGEVRDVEPRGPRTHTATLRRYRKDSDSPYMLAIDLYFHRKERDAATGEVKLICKTKWRLPNGKIEELLMPLGDFAKITDRETVTIVNREVKHKEKIVGSTTKRVVTEDYKIQKGSKVPMYERWEEVQCKVKLEDGTEFEIAENRLNM